MKPLKRARRVLNQDRSAAPFADRADAVDVDGRCGLFARGIEAMRHR
jgi:hypothetical protein